MQSVQLYIVHYAVLTEKKFTIMQKGILQEGKIKLSKLLISSR